MLRKYLLCASVLIFYIPTVSGQESLGDIARKLKAQKNGSQTTTTSPADSATPSANSAATAQAQSQSPAAPAKTVADTLMAPDLNPNFATDVHAADKYEAAIRQMLLQEKFQEIDRLAHEARATKARFPGGYWKIHIIYNAITQPPGEINASETDWTQLITHLERWKQQFPDSITARVALAESYNAYGWKARGGSYADQVSDEGWRLLAERAHKGQEILEDARNLPEKCPEWFAAMIAVGRSQQWNPDQLGVVFQQAAAFEPDYYYYYRMMADELLPKWSGAEGASAQFAEAVAVKLGGTRGDIAYFAIATTIVCACDNQSSLNGLAWSRIKNGYQALTEAYGPSISRMNEMALMALRAGEYDYSASLFDQIGDEWDQEVWQTPQKFGTFRFQATIPRMQRSLAAARDNMQTQEGKLFTTALAADLDKKYHQKLMDCMKNVPDFQAPAVTMLMRVTKEGSARDVMFSPPNVPATCFLPQLEQAVLLTPPKPDYWVIVQMPVKDPVTVGAK